VQLPLTPSQTLPGAPTLTPPCMMQATCVVVHVHWPA